MLIASYLLRSIVVEVPIRPPANGLLGDREAAGHAVAHFDHPPLQRSANPERQNDRWVRVGATKRPGVAPAVATALDRHAACRKKAGIQLSPRERRAGRRRGRVATEEQCSGQNQEARRFHVRRHQPKTTASRHLRNSHPPPAPWDT